MNEKDIVRVTSYTGSRCLKNAHKLRDLMTVYKQTFGESLATSCINCINDGLLRLRIELRKIKNVNQIKQQIMSEKRFELKKDVIIDLVYSGGGYVTADNLTDEKAEQLLKINIAYLKWFSKYPEKYNQPTPKAEPQKEPEPVEKYVSLLEIDKLISKHSKAELVEQLGLESSTLTKAELARQILEK